MITASFDEALLDRNIRKLAEIYGKPLQEVVRQQTRLVLIDCVKMTPPMEFGISTKQGFKDQKKMGETATNRDISRTFVDYKDLDVFKKDSSDEKSKGSRHIKSLIEQGRIEEANRLMRKLGWRAKEIVSHANLALHKSARDRRGRVSDRNRRYIVADGSSIESVRRIRVGRVGYAKSGWGKGAMMLGMKPPLPQWILRNRGSGSFQEVTGPNPSITVSNNVAAVAETDAEKRIVERALRYRVGKSTREVEHALAASLRRRGVEVTIS